ncbi:MAG: DUF4230 domain-containing protein [Prochlorotrichaceae cyanobacterium]|jgi:hypothetical protein
MFFLVKRLGNVAIGTVCVVGLLSLVGLWRSGGQFFQGLTAWITAPQPTPEVDVRSVMVNKIRGANELATAIFVMEAVVPTKRDRTLGNFTVGTTTLLYIAYGEVRAGVDLSKIEPQDIQVKENAIEITLPPPQILDGKIDVKRSDVYDYDRGFLGLGPDSAPELQTLAGQAALDKIIVTACSENILAQANQRAELAVGQLLSSVADKPITIKTQAVDPSLCVLPPSSTEESSPVD